MFDDDDLHYVSVCPDEMNCHGGRLNPTTCECDCLIEADNLIPNYMDLPDCKCEQILRYHNIN